MKFRSCAILALVLSLSVLACRLPQLGGPPTQPSPPTESLPVPPTVTLAAEPEATPPVEEIPPQPARPQEVIEIRSPGALAEISSPVQVSGIADPTFEQTLAVQITGVDGQVIAVQPATIQADIGQRGPYEVLIEFGVAEDQPGRISVYDVDARDGSLIHLSSVAVTLLAGGGGVSAPPEQAIEQIHIVSPSFNAEVSGGQLVVEGDSAYFFESNLGLTLCGGGSEQGGLHELCGTEGNLLTESFAIIEAPDVGQPGPFRGEVSYTVTESTPARVILYARSPRDGGLLHASSQFIMLNP